MMPDKITITGHSPDASQEWLLYAADDEVQADPLANSHAILAVPADDTTADHRNRVSFWKGVATAAAGSLVLAGGMAVVDATFGQQETAHISTPADQAPDKVDRDGTISENEARNIYLADEKRNAGLKKAMTRVTTEILAAIQADEVTVSSVVDLYEYEPIVTGKFTGDVIVTGENNGISFKLQAQIGPDGAFSFDPETMGGVFLDIANPSQESDTGAAIIAPHGVLFSQWLRGGDGNFASVRSNSGLTWAMYNVWPLNPEESDATANPFRVSGEPYQTASSEEYFDKSVAMDLNNLSQELRSKD